MISITTKSGSYEGVIFQEDKSSKLFDMRPRVSKAKTLDGGVKIDHRGYVDGDRELDIRAKNISEEQAAALEALVENETYVNLSCDAGFFEGTIAQLSIENGDISLQFWVRQQ